jgi:hypothetical protein
VCKSKFKLLSIPGFLAASTCLKFHHTSGVARKFFGGGGGVGSTNSVEDRENGDLEAVGPQSGVLEAAVTWYKKFHFI